MSSKGLLYALSLVLLLVVSCYPTCHARLLKGCVLGNGDSVLAATASDPRLNLALPTQVFKVSELRSSVSGGGSGGGGNLDAEDSNKDKYTNLRTLVLAALPKGTKASSGPSKRHNDSKT